MSVKTVDENSGFAHFEVWCREESHGIVGRWLVLNVKWYVELDFREMVVESTKTIFVLSSSVVSANAFNLFPIELGSSLARCAVSLSTCT